MDISKGAEKTVGRIYKASAIHDWPVSPLQIEELTRPGHEYAKIGQIPGRKWASD
jgi:hypothetical protein